MEDGENRDGRLPSIALRMLGLRLALSCSVVLGLSGVARALEPLPGLTETERLVFSLGASQFATAWHAAPSDDVAFDGLGPLYNATSCAACHPSGGAAPGPRFASDPTDLASRLAVVIEPADPTFGDQIQPIATGVSGEGLPTVTWSRQSGDGPDDAAASLVAPTYTLGASSYGVIAPDRAISGRVPPPLAGLGLLEAVPASAILANADPDDRDGDGISGVARHISVDGETLIGRFGWRAEQPTIARQTMHALSRDMGLSTDAFPDHFGDCTVEQEACRAAPHGAGGVSGPTEVPKSIVEQISAFIALSAPPASSEAGTETGAAIFADIGCAACHRPSLPVNDARGDRSSVAAYTDLLLHDMGEGLAARDRAGRIVDGEWRTAPLWGLGARADALEPGLLHDGRAISIVEAILWHGGEGARSRDAFRLLSEAQQGQLIAFLRSL